MKAAVLLSPRPYQVVRWGPIPENFHQSYIVSFSSCFSHLGEVEPVRSGVGGGEVGEPRRKKQREECIKEEEEGRNLRQNNLLKRKQELKG